MKSWIDSINFSRKKSLNEIFVGGIYFVNCQFVINKTASSHKIESYKIETCVFDKLERFFGKIKTSYFWQDQKYLDFRSCQKYHIKYVPVANF